MPKKLSAKSIRNVDKAHPFSRKADQLHRCALRVDKLQKQASSKGVERKREVERLLWFKFAVDEEKEVLTRPEIAELALMYIARNDEEIEALTASIQKGRQRPPRLALLTAMHEKEIYEYNIGVGMDIPDLTLAKNMKALRGWEGDWNAMDVFKMMKFRKPILLDDSTTESKDTSMIAEDTAPAPVAKVETSITIDILR